MPSYFAAHIIAEGDHASRPDAATSPTGALYSCSDHGKIYRNTGSAWTDWAVLGGDLATHTGDTTDAHDASAISIADVGTLFTGTDVEAALAEAMTAASAGVNPPGSISAVFDGGGDAIASGSYVDIVIPDDGTITSWTALADQSGSIEFDLQVDSYANYPPAAGDSIVAAAPPAISGATKATSSTLTGWTTSITQGNIMRVVVDSVTTIEKVTLFIAFTRS